MRLLGNCVYPKTCLPGWTCLPPRSQILTRMLTCVRNQLRKTNFLLATSVIDLPTYDYVGRGVQFNVADKAF